MKNILGKHLNLLVAVLLKSSKEIHSPFVSVINYSGRVVDQ